MFWRKLLKSFLFIANKHFLSKGGHKSSVAELHHFDAAPAPGKNYDAALAAPTLLPSKAKFLKRSKV
jgi:hypothetical protein